jgi:hypothetical protein
VTRTARIDSFAPVLLVLPTGYGSRQDQVSGRMVIFKAFPSLSTAIHLPGVVFDLKKKRGL